MKENEYVICQVQISQGSFVREMSLPVYPIYSDDIRHFREEGVDDPVWHPPHVVASVFLPKKILLHVINNVLFHNVIYLKFSTGIAFCFLQALCAVSMKTYVYLYHVANQSSHPNR